MSGLRGIVLDMEGVLHVDWHAIPGSPEAVAALQGRGLATGVLTNTTGKTRADIAARLAGMGFPIAAGQITTAASAAAAHLRSQHAGRRVYALVESGATGDLDGIELVGD